VKEQDRPLIVADSRVEPRGPIEWMRWIPAGVLGLSFLILLLISGRIILVPLLSSLALAYLLAPVVSWFERRGWSHRSSALLAMLVATLSLILALFFILPSLWGQLNTSYHQARALIDDDSRRIAVLEKIKQVSPPLHEFVESKIKTFDINDELERYSSVALRWLQSGLFRMVDLTTSILDLLLIPFFVFYLLADYRAMRHRVDRLIPPRYRAITADLISQVNTVLSAYVRSQLLIALVMGVLYSIGFAVLRVPLAFTLGMLSGLLNFVPYLGTLTGCGLSILFVALDGGGIGRVIGVLAVFALVQSLEGYYLTPRLLGSRLNLHPLGLLIGLMVGGNLFGLLGIILAVPVIAIAKVVLGFLEALYQDSDFYRRAGLNLLTDQGQPVDLVTQSPGLILEEPLPDRPRRTIITTGELKSRIRERGSGVGDQGSGVGDEG
jgi:predicted PurR-regulated permease PerM